MSSTGTDDRDAALILLGFASALRRSELAALEVADITSKPGGLLITVRRSKGDPHAVGQIVAVAEGRWADSDPLAALGVGCTSAPARQGTCSPVCTRTAPSRAIRSPPPASDASSSRAHAVGFSADRITAHSLRAGHATSAAMAGVSLDRIAAQTRSSAT